MNEVKETKGSKVVYILLGMAIVIIIVLLGIIFAGKLLNNDNNETINNISDNNNAITSDNQSNNQNTTINNSVEQTVPFTDTYAISINENCYHEVYLLNEGYLYYYVTARNNDKCEEYGDVFMTFNTEPNGTESLFKYEKISHIKRLKSYNSGNGVNFAVYAITEDGKVYHVNNQQNGTVILEIVDGLKKYNVYDITYIDERGYAGTEPDFRYKIVLNDGSTINLKTIN